MSRVQVAVSIRREEVVRFLGYPPGREPSGKLAELLDQAIEEARGLASACGTWRSLPVGRATEVGLRPLEARALVIGLVTAGGRIEARASALAASGEVSRAVLLDAAGSAVAEEAADRLGAEIVGAEGGGPAAEVPCRLSPGYGRWPLTAQPALFALLDHGAVGVQLLPSLLMVPRKSVSFAMWLGAAGPPAEGLAGCARCALHRCRYRRAAVRDGRPEA